MRAQYASIPTLSGGTVATANKQTLTFPPGQQGRLTQLAYLVTSAGAHANFVITVEVQVDGQWLNAAISILNTATGFTINNLGIALASAAIATAGGVLNFNLSRISAVRVGIAGNGAPGGTAFLIAS